MMARSSRDFVARGGVIVRFEVWFPVVTLILGGLLVMGQSWIESRWGRKERRESQREQFQYEKLTELLTVAARWHAIVDRHYWHCVEDEAHLGTWPIGPNDEPLDPTDRPEYNQLWTELKVLSFLIHDQEMRDQIDGLRDAGVQAVVASNHSNGTKAYQEETEAYLAVAKRIGQLLSADLDA